MSPVQFTSSIVYIFMKRRFTEDSWHKEPWFKGLISALRSCHSDADMAALLRDIGTLSELQAWSERLEVARLIAQGMSYRAIAKTTGASTTTVTRVAHFLENGEGGYRTVLHTHRHHRMKKGQKTQPDQGKKQVLSPRPVSPLQKYLERRE